MIPDWLKPRRGREAIVYLAVPSRLSHRFEEFAEHTRQSGYAPVYTFEMAKRKDFEDGIVGREDTIWFTSGTQTRAPGGTRVYGASDGTFKEVLDRLSWDSQKRIRVFPKFDPAWDEWCERLRSQFGDPFSALRGRNRLIALVGASAAGKTYWIEKLKRIYGANLQRVKNVTTRAPRDENDDRYYYRVSKEQFEEGIKGGAFLEYDQYLDEYYGSSLDEIKSALRKSHGIFAVTPAGAQALYECRLEINVSIVLLRPESPAVLEKNLDRRGELDSAKRTRKLREAENFKLPPEIEHTAVEVIGERPDKERILNVINPLLK